MKPCSSYRKRIAALAAEALDASQSSHVREHLKTCPGCQGYWRELARVCRAHSEAADRLPDASPSASFHNKWVARIRESEAARPSWALTGVFPRAAAFWRVAIPAGGLAAALLIVRLTTGGGLNPSGANGPFPSSHPTVSAVRISPDSTYSTYRAAANRSLDALDDLLNQQGAKVSSGAEILTVSTARRLALGE